MRRVPISSAEATSTAARPKTSADARSIVDVYRVHSPEKVATARRLREAGSSYAEIAGEIGISWSTARNWTLDLRPDLARSGKDAEAIRRSRARATRAIADAVERGSCGTAGCRI